MTFLICLKNNINAIILRFFSSKIFIATKLSSHHVSVHFRCQDKVNIKGRQEHVFLCVMAGTGPPLK